MAYTDFYCDPVNGNNANGGSDASASPTFTDASASWNGTSVITTSVSTASITVGQFANIGGTYIARVTATTGTTITVSTTAVSGSVPASGTRATRVGGAWLGPNGATAFPIGVITGAAQDTNTDPVRVNFKNNATYSITAAMTSTSSGSPKIYQGYTSTPGDGGTAIIAGPASGASFTLLTVALANDLIANITFQNNGSTGSATGVNCSASQVYFYRCVFSGFRGPGLSTNTFCTVVECEAFSNNKNNGANNGGFIGSAGVIFLRCYSHDNTGSSSNGFASASTTNYINCIAESNGQAGFFASTGTLLMSGCDAYNNTSNGVTLGTGTNNITAYVENCNFFKNGGYGIATGTTGIRIGIVTNSTLGSGSQANTSGGQNVTTIVFQIFTFLASGTTPWNSPTTGDFSIVNPANFNTGEGFFLETGNSKTGTVAYPDIGAAQHRDTSTVINQIVNNYYTIEGEI